MRLKRSLFFTLILFFMIFSVSFVSASDIPTNDINTNTLSTISENNMAIENSNDITVELNEDSSTSSQADETQFTDETKNNESEFQSTDETENVKNEAPILGASDDGYLACENQILAAADDGCLDDENQILSADNNQILRAGTPYIDNETFYNGCTATAQDVINTIRDLSSRYGDSSGAVLYLNGNTFSGRGELQAGDGQIIEIKNVKVIGGTVNDPTRMATFTTADQWSSEGIALNFRGRSSDWGTQFYSNSGYSLTNVSFYYLDSQCKLFQFAGGGTLTDCVIDHCQSVKQFVALVGCSDQRDQWGNLIAPKKPIHLNNCNFTYCNQTYGFNPEAGYDDYYDGNGQFGAVLGAALNNCNFINTTSGQHGGALCIADESEWGPATVTSTIYNTNFINVTSRWFAIYLHGKFKTSPADLDYPEEIINCTFVNCIATGEYSGGIGISHSDLLIENSCHRR